MGFVASFLENATVEEFWKSANNCETHVRMYSGTAFLTQCLNTFNVSNCYVDPSAAEFRRRRQPEACRAAAAGKNSARRRASRNLWTPPPPYFPRRAAALAKNRVGVNL